MDDEEHEAKYEVVMPFVVCESTGGKFNDDSYAAGWEASKIDSELAVANLFGALPAGRTVLRPNLPQLDLVAMRYGFVMTTELPEAFIDWAHVSFERLEEDG